MEIYRILENKQKTLKEKLSEISNLNDKMAEKGACINNSGYMALLKTALEYTNITNEKELAEKVKIMVEEIETGIKKKTSIFYSTYGFKKKIESLLS